MKPLRIGLIGMGGMGSGHARAIQAGKVNNAVLAAVCDTEERDYSSYGDVNIFTDSQTCINSGEVDAVIIATPHYSHTTIGIEALKAGLHVLVEKPISVHKADCERLIAAHTNPKQVFCAMFNQRTDPAYRKVRDLIQQGELGPIRRINWIITNWFRTQAYYNSGGWRATWSGEGGGVLLNQCPHQIDLWQWLFGMPARMRAFCQIGRYHDIEVEDNVTAYMEYADGASGVFITSTGEAPGTNRLEITGDRGRLIFEDGKLRFTRNEVPMDKFCATSSERFGTPPVWEISIPIHGANTQHVGIMNNFVEACLEGKPLIAPAEEGIHSVELANAMLMSSFENRTIDLPLDAAAYEKLLKKKIDESTWVKPEVRTGKTSDDLSGSFR